MTAWPDGTQSALSPLGAEAAWTAQLAWILFAGAAVILVVVMALALYAAFARRERTNAWRGRVLIVGGGIVFPVTVLSGLLVYSLTGAAPAGALGDEDEDVLRVEIVAQQWWWRIHYLTAEGRRDFALANELVLPVGRTVVLELRSADVIHSFWVPALAGKLDMIPGRTQILRVRADRPGRARGQCAEYCGGPHGLMALDVFAATAEDYARWAQRQRQAAPAPATTQARAGRDIFVARCGVCHAVRGSAAVGSLGPDLTHVGTRRSLGAGALPASSEAMADWIVSAQRFKPGSLMPAFPELAGAEARAIAAYLAAPRQ